MLMSVSARLGTLGLVDGTALPDGTSIEFERNAVGFFPKRATLLVAGGQPADVVGMVRDGDLVTECSVADENGSDLACQVTVTSLPELFACVRDADGTVRTARAIENTWTFDLRFPNRDAASGCLSRYDGGSLTVDRIGSPSILQDGSGITPTEKQREVLVRALAAGYFDVPRRTSLVSLADDLGISDTAASERLRRGTKAVLGDAGYERYDPD